MILPLVILPRTMRERLPHAALRHTCSSVFAGAAPVGLGDRPGDEAARPVTLAAAGGRGHCSVGLRADSPRNDRPIFTRNEITC